MACLYMWLLHDLLVEICLGIWPILSKYIVGIETYYRYRNVLLVYKLLYLRQLSKKTETAKKN